MNKRRRFKAKRHQRARRLLSMYNQLLDQNRFAQAVRIKREYYKHGVLL